MFWIQSALAQTATTPVVVQTAQATGEQPNFLMSIVPFIFMIAVFYFLVMRPQAKRQKDQQNFLVNLKRGDEVITSGGILGRIEGLTDMFVNLEVSDGVRLRVLRSQIASSAKLETNPSKG